jgi:hypothetical protein
MNKRDLGCQREDRILVAEEEILHEIENQQRTNTPHLANYLFSLLMFHLMLLLTITVFLLCCFLNKLQALFYHHLTKLTNETQKNFNDKNQT